MNEYSSKSCINMAAEDSSLPSPPRPLFTLRPRASEVTAVQYTALDHREAILIGTTSGVIGLWDIETKREFWKQSCERGIISVLPESTLNPKEIISLSRQGSVCVWDIESEKNTNEFGTPDPGFCNFIILKDNDIPNDVNCISSKLIALGGRDYGQVNVFDTQSGKQVITLKSQLPETKGMVMSLSRGGGEEGGKELILCGCEDGSVMMFDIRVSTKGEINSLKMFPEPVMCIDYDSTRNHGVCGSPLNTLETFKISEQKLLEAKYSVPVRNNGIGCVSIRHDGRVMASGGWDGRIRVFGCKKGKPLAILDYHTGTVHSLSFTSSHSLSHSNLMIGGSKDERVSLWKLY